MLPDQALTESEKRRVVTLEDGEYVCSDADYAEELAYLKKKVDAGGDFIITQVCVACRIDLVARTRPT